MALKQAIGRQEQEEIFMQTQGKIALPQGKKIAVSIGCDFDAFSLWDGSFGKTSPAYLSRGEFGAEVGSVRLLELFDKYDIKTTWFVPGHTADTFPERVKAVIAAGHEIGVHGYIHEEVGKFDHEGERAVMRKALDALERVGVKNPVSYRSPSWDFSSHTIAVLEEFGFRYDSSLMGNDFHCYRPRPYIHHSDRATEFGPESGLIELPCSWFLDDFPYTEYISNVKEGLTPPSQVLETWKETFDYALLQEGACFTLTIHPQVSGRGHMIVMLERLIRHMSENRAWIRTVSEIGSNCVFE
jgi:peptidoglycan/xylan/chitin deacetylase (PgdA/CDA1 family)